MADPATLGGVEFPWWTPPDRPAAGKRVVADEGPNGTCLAVIDGFLPPFAVTLFAVGDTAPAVAAMQGTVQTLTIPGSVDHLVAVDRLTVLPTPAILDGAPTTLWTVAFIAREVGSA